MNRPSLSLAVVAILLVAVVLGGAAWAQTGGNFDRGSCVISCLGKYGGPSAWTGDRSQSDNFSYSRCTQQCDIRYWDDQDRRTRGFDTKTR